MTTETTYEGDEAATWAARINRAWAGTVSAIIDTGQLLLDAKEKLNHGEWAAMFTEGVPERILFSQPYANKLMRIARVLGNCSDRRNLPSVVAPLYEFSGLAPEIREAKLATGEMNPETTEAQVKAWNRPTSPDTPWSYDEMVKRFRRVAEAARRRVPAEQHGLVARAWRTVMHDMDELSPEMREWLEAERGALLLDEDPHELRDRNALGRWIINQGGLDATTRDRPNSPALLRLFASNGKGLSWDELIDRYAKQHHHRYRDVKRRFEYLFSKPGPQRTKSPRALKAEISHIDAVLEGKALPIRFFPSYAGPRLSPRVRETMLRDCAMAQQEIEREEVAAAT